MTPGKQVKPKVSLVMPTYNSSRFLEYRLQSIFAQTLSEWELVVIDSYSDDGSRERLEALALGEGRVRFFSMPREGIYPAINYGIQQARGEYIYIATSDDTMYPNCLERMVLELERHPDCDMCHTSLEVIDEEGEVVPNWWADRPVTKFYGSLDTQKHIRQAPLDGILHLSLFIIYGSLTQLMIRKTVFEKVGLFRSDWGPRGDFEWGMRAGTVCNTVHLPERLATWRIHPDQATSPAQGSLLQEMVDSALPTMKKHYPDLFGRLRVHRLLSLYRQLEIMQEIQRRENLVDKLFPLLVNLLRRPGDTLRLLVAFVRGQNILHAEPGIVYLRRHLRHLGLLDELVHPE